MCGFAFSSQKGTLGIVGEMFCLISRRTAWKWWCYCLESWLRILILSVSERRTYEKGHEFNSRRPLVAGSPSSPLSLSQAFLFSHTHFLSLLLAVISCVFRKLCVFVCVSVWVILWSQRLQTPTSLSKNNKPHVRPTLVMSLMLWSRPFYLKACSKILGKLRCVWGVFLHLYLLCSFNLFLG